MLVCYQLKFRLVEGTVIKVVCFAEASEVNSVHNFAVMDLFNNRFRQLLPQLKCFHYLTLELIFIDTPLPLHDVDGLLSDALAHNLLN